VQNTARNLNSDSNSIGGKARSLTEAVQAGFSVPDFVVIPANAWLPPGHHSDSWPMLKSLVDALSKSNQKIAVASCAAALRRRILKSQIPQQVLRLIADWVKRAKNSPWTFVRSSADSEDTGLSSSAGQYTSQLARTSLQQIGLRAREVISSYYGERAIAYRNAHKLPQEGPRMGLILQEALEPEAAGIAFACHPVTFDDGVIVVEANFGFGTTVVAGQVTPDCFFIRKPTLEIEKKTRGSKRFQARIGSFGLDQVLTSPSQAERYCLSDPSVRQVAELCRAAERHFGSPQDIEWALKGELLWLLQSRPITGRRSRRT